MKYNFDEIIDRRNTNATSTDGYKAYIFGKTFNMAGMQFSNVIISNAKIREKYTEKHYAMLTYSDKTLDI